MSRRADVRRDDGLTIIELMVSMVVGLIVFLGLFTFLDITSSGSQEVAGRIEANRQARPVMQRITDYLHSTCVAPGIAPVLAGSTDTSISFVHQTGSAVAPVPVKRTISLTSGTLTETAYAVSSGTAPNWVFSTTPIANSTRQMLKPVVPAMIGTPPVAVPTFRYYAFGTNGTISTTPLPATAATPLSAANAAKVVQVNVSFAVPSKTVKPDPDGTLTLSDTVTLRFTPPGETASTENLPCV